MTNKLEQGANDLLWAVRRSIRYHSRRERFFDLFHLWTTTLKVLSGSAAVAAFVTDGTRTGGLIASVVVTALPIIDLVFGTEKKARLHSGLSRNFVDLERQIVLAPSKSESGLARFEARRLEIEAQEPPILRVLDILCHNELARALGHPETELYDVKWYQRWAANCFDWNEQGIKLRKKKKGK